MIDYTRIPDHMMDSIKRYTEYGIPPGGFLTAVITNDLKEAVERADDVNIRLLPEYVAYFYSKAPAGCWGSLANFKHWIEKHSAANLEAIHD